MVSEVSEFGAYLERERQPVNAALEVFLAREQAAADALHPLAREVFDAVAEFTLGPGKRLRPILMIAAYRAVGGSDEDAILAASTCLELTQTMLLIHDDIMDRSELRRGRPSVHAAFAQRYGGAVSGQACSSDPAHFGLALAIAAGDLAGQLAVRALVSAPFSLDCQVRALNTYTAMTRDVCYGQVLDMHASDAYRRMNEQDVLTIHRYKTARYTTEGPMHLGAVLACASDGMVAQLSAYALPLGLAFQLQDDLLGVFGSESETGKSADADLKEGKRTLLVLKALEWGNEGERAALEAVLSNSQASGEQVEAARRAIAASGAQAYCRQRTGELAAEAVRALDGLPIAPEQARFLRGLVDYVIERVR